MSASSLTLPRANNTELSRPTSLSTGVDVRSAPPPRSVALVGTYPPTACGLATFTSNLRAAIASCRPGWTAKVVRLVDRRTPERSPDVVADWIAGDEPSLARSIDVLYSFDAVVLQHEYGIYPGVDGDGVLDLVEALEAPLVAVLHTALDSPGPHQRDVLDRLLDTATAVTVQS